MKAVVRHAIAHVRHQIAHVGGQLTHLATRNAPDAFLVAGAVCFCVGVWQWSPALGALFAGVMCLLVGFGLANDSSRHSASPDTREAADAPPLFTLDDR